MCASFVFLMPSLCLFTDSYCRHVLEGFPSVTGRLVAYCGAVYLVSVIGTVPSHGMVALDLVAFAQSIW